MSSSPIDERYFSEIDADLRDVVETIIIQAAECSGQFDRVLAFVREVRSDQCCKDNWEEIACAENGFIEDLIESWRVEKENMPDSVEWHPYYGGA